ncbi:hypothetical protein GYMLUDRAFT_75254 [Collybiopsis luxurians FD-317 M1]|uniref:Uncharacterized protein n=1 Tax=Collybiopsis luxurians FD-317 M1 TaxID=944289 RepID=A0A0D0BR04_9AGAR|nr:hypothetical protein GYMLUDRAFT_75254 [Collybiopsis luxurians FD-317 M1]
MPEYVYALHDFAPENDDEVSFKAGERVEVLEKDEAYGDGWWQGRNLAGKVGLFPQSYTAPAPPELEEETKPVTSTTPSLKPLSEEADSESSPAQAPPAIFVNGNETGDGEVMKATLTDVQKAIEQLGRNRASSVDGDGARSFSFASTRDRDTDRESETDYDLSDTDNPEFGDEGHHKSTRQRLAEKARKAVEEAEKLEMMMGGMSAGNRSSAPPIAVELSDESEGEEDLEEDYTHTSSFLRRHSAIEEEDEEAETEGNGTGTAPSQTPQAHQELTLPEQELDESEAPTATAPSFPVLPPPSDSESPDKKSVSLPTPVSPGFAHPDSTVTSSTVTAASTPPVFQPLPAPSPRSPSPLRDSVSPALVGLPSPTASSFHSSGRGQHNSLTSSLRSSTAAPTSNEAELQPSSSQAKEKDNTDNEMVNSEKEKPNETASSDKSKGKTHPSEWTVEQVIEWIRSKGFGEDVCEKFTEQEITGDVLLELDVNVLKNEIGIMAFGKRVRIANAIADLKRPPSSVGGYDGEQDHGPPSSFPGMQSVHVHGMSPQLFAQQSPHSLNSQPYSHPHSTHSRTQSQSQSHHSYPGTVGSIGGYRDSRDSYGSAGMNGTLIAAAGLISPESAPHTGDIPGTPGSPRTPVMMDDGYIADGQRVGLGLKARPANLMLSPSDSALNTSVETEEDRAALSEGETPSIAAAKHSRRKLFGRSHDSAASGNSGKGSKHSSLKEAASPISSPTADSKEEDGKDKEDKEKAKEGVAIPRTHSRSRKSLDAGKSGERLSIFGGTFPSMSGKGKTRKPPPRYSIASDDVTSPHDKAAASGGSSFHLPRFSTGPRKSSTSGRPGSSSGYKDKGKDGLLSPEGSKSGTVRDPSLLRKRTSSYPGPGSSSTLTEKKHNTDENGNGNANGNGHAKDGSNESGPLSPLKPGQSILDQIGEPDHFGWMRKKGDRYNSWKMRYFVLKGPHMYCLRSDSHAETKIKGYINIIGYKVTVDENVNPGKYGFRIDHENDKSHYFSSEEKSIIRDWMKAIMKATIGRDYTKPVISSVNIPTIPLMVAQAMNPAPRPPSPTARDATQKALRRENPNQLSSRDARVLMGLPTDSDSKDDRVKLESFFHSTTPATVTPALGEKSKAATPPRPSREARRASVSQGMNVPIDDGLIEWANSYLPASLQITDTSGSICGGLTILRLAEAIKGRPSSPPVPDSAFPTDPTDDKLDGLFRLFDFLLDNDVKMGSVSINDIRQGKRDKVLQLLKALKAWEDKRKALAHSIGRSPVQAGGFIAPAYGLPLST